MSVKVQTVMTVIEELAPKKLAEEWDNVGLMVGDPKKEVKKVLCALDAYKDVVDYAVENKFDMIVTHHPLIFSKLKSINGEIPLGNKILKLIQNNISVYSAHTNFDITPGGVCDVLCNRIGVEAVKVLEITLENDKGVYGSGRIGKLEDGKTLEEYAKDVKKALNLEHIRIIGDKDKIIKKVAVCSGSGDSLVSKAKFAGADAYVTGDIKYHVALDAVEMGLSIIDAGHYATEIIAIEVMMNYLKGAKPLKDIEIEMYLENYDPIKVI